MPQPLTNYQQKQIVRKHSAYAMESKEGGYPDHRITQELLNKGLDREMARDVVSGLASAPSAQRDAARQAMWTGGLICLCGILVTLGTYGIAAANGGGVYLIAFGAILGGGYRFLRGLSKLP